MQTGKLVHGQINIAFHKPYLDLVQSLLPLMPHKSLDTFFFWNSGAEAVEAAVKLARHATKKQNVIVMQGSYHGRTFGTMAMTRSKTIYGENFAPLMPGVFSVPFPYCAQCSIAKRSNGEYSFDNCCMDPVLQLELLLKRETAASDTAAIFIEPVLGEGGYGKSCFLSTFWPHCFPETCLRSMYSRSFVSCFKYPLMRKMLTATSFSAASARISCQGPRDMR